MAKLHICRDHNGKFKPPSRRGRPPVRCNEDFPCSNYSPTVEVQGKQSTKTKLAKATGLREEQIIIGASKEPKFKPDKETGKVTALKASIAKAKAAKAELVAKGWTVEGRVKDNRAEITAVRDDEMIFAVWENGILAQPMQYSLWSVEKPSENTKPESDLPFDIDEIPDGELVRILNGEKVTWYNRLGQREEKAVIGPNKITIEHLYDGHGNETPADRIVKFTDHETKTFKAFRLGALLKVGN